MLARIRSAVGEGKSRLDSDGAEQRRQPPIAKWHEAMPVPELHPLSLAATLCFAVQGQDDFQLPEPGTPKAGLSASGGPWMRGCIITALARHRLFVVHKSVTARWKAATWERENREECADLPTWG